MFIIQVNYPYSCSLEVSNFYWVRLSKGHRQSELLSQMRPTQLEALHNLRHVLRDKAVGVVGRGYRSAFIHVYIIHSVYIPIAMISRCKSSVYTIKMRVAAGLVVCHPYHCHLSY